MNEWQLQALRTALLEQVSVTMIKAMETAEEAERAVVEQNAEFSKQVAIYTIRLAAEKDA